MEKNDFLFEKMFAGQIAKMANFPDEILMALMSKKELLKNRISGLNLEISESSFTPVIPDRKMKAIEQLAYLVHHSHSPKGISDIYHNLEGFFYNEPRVSNLSPVLEIGYIIDIKILPLSSFTINKETSLYQNGSALRKNVEKVGYIPANHTEAFMLAYHSDLLPIGSGFCALNCSWENYEFAKIAHGRDLKYGLWWITPSIEKGKVVEADNILVPAYKEFI